MNYTIDNIENYLNFDNIDTNDWIEPIYITALKAFSDDKNQNIQTKNSYLNTILNGRYSKSKSYTPIENIKSRNNIENLANKLTEIILKNFNYLSLNEQKDLKDYLRYLFTEMMNNVSDHSLSPVGGYAMAQYYPNKKMVQFAIADRGVGFLKNVNLKDNSIDNEADAIIKAIEKGFTATPPRVYGAERNAGFGLYALKEIIDSTQGKFVIISNDMLVRYKNSAFTKKKLSNSYKGSIVAFNFIESEIKLSMNDFKQNVLWKIEEDDDDFY
jgi:hypothetical protein